MVGLALFELGAFRSAGRVELTTSGAPRATTTVSEAASTSTSSGAVTEPATTLAPIAVPTTVASRHPATTVTSPPPGRAAVVTTTTVGCTAYPAATYGINPNATSSTGGGTQLVTVVAASGSSRSATLVAWAKRADGCWVPAAFAGEPAQPYRAQTGYGGLLPLSQRVSGDGATPLGLYSFGSTIYGNSAVSPSSLYPYHHLICGDWWDEHPGSPTYETFQHVDCATTPAYAADSEALWTETQPYQHFIDIPMPHPPDNASGIFLHDDTTSGYTAGCVALPNGELDAVLGWLNPAASPHILIAVA